MYVAHVGVGTPPTTYTLIVDTGSANTWISDPTKGGMPYARTKTSHGTGNRVGVKYASGYFKGNEFLDDLTLGKGLRAEQQSIGVAYQHRGYNYWDGILGYVVILMR
jgi:cathepsin E